MLPLWSAEPSRRVPIATTILVVLNFAVFAYEALLASESYRALQSFIMGNALSAQRLIAHTDDPRAWLTILTSMFLHGSVMHVVGNCWFLWVFGKNIEDRLGSMRFVVFYLLCGVAAAALQVAVFPGASVPMIGASGAISGVLGAYFILLPFSWIFTLVPWFVPIVPVPAAFFLIVWFAVQAMSGAGSLLGNEAVEGGVAWWAHVGGFIGGIALILLARKAHWLRRR
ncbi:MAG TPA: rhomboid family intramembrane serine protease [Opitutaceae bacterium]|nr:rhomboid family intramembrane serine protease [Opitutaceae bacterium]